MGICHSWVRNYCQSYLIIEQCIRKQSHCNLFNSQPILLKLLLLCEYANMNTIDDHVSVFTEFINSEQKISAFFPNAAASWRRHTIHEMHVPIINPIKFYTTIIIIKISCLYRCQIKKYVLNEIDWQWGRNSEFTDFTWKQCNNCNTNSKRLMQ